MYTPWKLRHPENCAHQKTVHTQNTAQTSSYLCLFTNNLSSFQIRKRMFNKEISCALLLSSNITMSFSTGSERCGEFKFVYTERLDASKVKIEHHGRFIVLMGWQLRVLIECADWVCKLSVQIECADWARRLSVPIECADWVCRLSVQIECADWVCRLSVQIECADWARRLSADWAQNEYRLNE